MAGSYTSKEGMIGAGIGAGVGTAVMPGVGTVGGALIGYGLGSMMGGNADVPTASGYNYDWNYANQMRDQAQASREGQNAALRNMQLRAEGKGGPSVAERQLAQSQIANDRAAQSMAASARGGASARMLAQRQAMDTQAQGRMQSAGQAATLRAQEQMAAEQGVLAGYGQMRGQDMEGQGLDQNRQLGMAQAHNTLAATNMQGQMQNAKTKGGVFGSIMNAGVGILSDERAKEAAPDGYSAPDEIRNPWPGSEPAGYSAPDEIRDPWAGRERAAAPAPQREAWAWAKPGSIDNDPRFAKGGALAPMEPRRGVARGENIDNARDPWDYMGRAGYVAPSREGSYQGGRDYLADRREAMPQRERPAAATAQPADKPATKADIANALAALARHPEEADAPQPEATQQQAPTSYSDMWRSMYARRESPLQGRTARESIDNYMMSDERSKMASGADGDIRSFMDNLEPVRYRYKDGTPADDGGITHYGVIAQDAERSPVGKTMVREDPESGYKVIDGREATQASLAAIADLNSRLRKIEGRR